MRKDTDFFLFVEEYVHKAFSTKPTRVEVIYKFLLKWIND